MYSVARLIVRHLLPLWYLSVRTVRAIATATKQVEQVYAEFVNAKSESDRRAAANALLSSSLMSAWPAPGLAA